MQFSEFSHRKPFFLPAETQPRIADTTEPGTRELMTAQASIVPIPAPMTPKTGIKRALKMTSSTHMTAFKILGVTISPLHCRKDDISELSWENGSMMANIIK